MKNYKEMYSWFKRFSLIELEEIRKAICIDGKNSINSLKLQVIDDLCYLKQYGIKL